MRKFRSVRVLFVFFLLLISSAISFAGPFDDSSSVRLTNEGDSSSSETSKSKFLDCLTPEETKLLNMGLLPGYYPSLKLYREEKGLNAAIELCKSYYPEANGNFSNDFGNPDRMLSWARWASKDEKLVEMLNAATVGDVFLSGPTSGHLDDNLICQLTRGTYSHATLVKEVPPPLIIEATGIADNSEDPYRDKVRMTMWYEELTSGKSLRLVRPTDGQSPEEAERMINQALAYAHEQLGKPYDYAFTNADGDKAFYCSELVSKAYKSAGCDIANKNAERDKVVVVLQSLIDKLDAKDRTDLATKIVKFASAYVEHPDFNSLQNFIIYTVIPGCNVFSKAYPNEESLHKLNDVINIIKEGDAFKHFEAANKKYYDDEAAGKYDVGFGIGALRKAKAKAAVGLAITKDLFALNKKAGTKISSLSKVAFELFMPIYQNLGSVTKVVSGLSNSCNVELPGGVKSLIKMADWVLEKRKTVEKWPVVGKTLVKLMPGNNDGNFREDFTSPTDLAYCSPNCTYTWP